MLGNTRTTPIVLNLMIINVLVYVAQRLLDSSFQITNLLALYPIGSGYFKPYQLLTYMFAHSPQNIFHILFNMYALWMFGTILERVWGPKKFLIFYLVCGIAAGLTEMFLVSNSQSLGASGAIMGLVGAFAYLFPNTKFFILPIPFPIKAKYMVALMAAFDLFGGFYPGGLDDVAHFAHLGGMLMGFILVIIWGREITKRIINLTENIHLILGMV